MTRRTLTLTALTITLAAALTLPAAANESTPIDVTCTYNQVVAGCRKQIVFTDDLGPLDDIAYDGHVKTPDGDRAARCVHISDWEIVCVLGDLITTAVDEDPADDDVVPVLTCPPGFTAQSKFDVDSGIINHECVTATPTGEPVAAPIPTFTG